MPVVGLEGEPAGKGRLGMAGALVDRAWAWLHAKFPERQIYIRSEGRVQFFTFGSSLQATCAGLALIFLGWVAFTSVNVIFKDRIIAARDHRFQQMQSTYENRVADLQLSYDELNDALVSAEDRFKSTADEIEAKQRTVAKLVDDKQSLDADLNQIGKTGSSLKGAGREFPRSMQTGSNTASDSLGFDSGVLPGSVGLAVAPASARASSGSGSSRLTIMQQSAEPQPRTAKPSQASMLGDTLTRFAESWFRPTDPPAQARPLGTPALRPLALQTNRLNKLGEQETGVLIGIDSALRGRVGHVQNLLQRVGLSSTALARELPELATGGPLVSVQSMHVDGISDPGFTTAYVSAVAHEQELSALVAALRHVPLSTPVHGSQFELTSGFGPRVDPFTSRIAFHTGVDFAGPWGSTVVATAPGVVVWSGPRGGYGNMVEIDHGLGFRTRYGHLSSTLVRPGTQVREGSPVGRLGSTGRSTGPHVHYEVWQANVVKDPGRYIEAGRHAFE
jgi:murein DD-endopeptidase MepM/ murein hydrolase activator NlpD